MGLISILVESSDEEYIKLRDSIIRYSIESRDQDIENLKKSDAGKFMRSQMYKAYHKRTEPNYKLRKRPDRRDINPNGPYFYQRKPEE